MVAMAELGALNSLLRSSSIEDHEEALRLADAAVKSSRSGGDDLAAHHTKVVSLLKLDRFDDALRALAAAGSRLEDQCALEKAYALYKSGQLSEAEAVLDKAHQSRGASHVAAQIAYRAEKFDRAAAIYRDLLAAAGEGMLGEENDLRINLLAADAQLEWAGDGHLVPANERQPGREAMEAFETAYNAACACLARGDFAKAAMLLRRSRDLCEASEDLADEEKKAELVPIIVQQAYVSTKLGKLEEAAALQNAVTMDEQVSQSLHCYGVCLLTTTAEYLMLPRRRSRRTTLSYSNHMETPISRRSWYEPYPRSWETTGFSSTNPPCSGATSTPSSSSARNSRASRRQQATSLRASLPRPCRRTRQRSASSTQRPKQSSRLARKRSAVSCPCSTAGRTTSACS